MSSWKNKKKIESKSLDKLASVLDNIDPRFFPMAMIIIILKK